MKDNSRYRVVTENGITMPCLDDVLKRTRPEGDCLIWTNACNGCGYPILRLNKKSLVVRTVMAFHVIKNKKKTDVVTNTCMDKRCIAPDHLRAVSRKVLAKKMDKTYTKCPIRSAKLSEQARKQSKLTQEIANFIRVEEGTHSGLALKYGVSKRCIHGIKSGKNWRDSSINIWRALMQ